LLASKELFAREISPSRRFRRKLREAQGKLSAWGSSAQSRCIEISREKTSTVEACPFAASEQLASSNFPSLLSNDQHPIPPNPFSPLLSPPKKVNMPRSRSRSPPPRPSNSYRSNRSPPRSSRPGGGGDRGYSAADREREAAGNRRKYDERSDRDRRGGGGESGSGRRDAREVSLDGKREGEGGG